MVRPGDLGGKTMTAALMARRAGRQAAYTPPSDVCSITLADALRFSGRLSSAETDRMLDLFIAKIDRHQTDNIALYYVGDLSLLQSPCVAVVGTREVSPEGSQRARRIARELAGSGIIVVSGLAAGVDTAAHTSAINAKGRTVAVIGTPLNKAYPTQNRELQEQIYRDHLLVSQFEVGSHVYQSNFPRRNKVMAALCDATVIVEASDTSGTLHQAAECVRLGRWLFILKSVVENAALKWPAKFLHHDKVRVLDSTSQIIDSIRK